MDKHHWIELYENLKSYVQENEFRSFEVYCMTLNVHKKENTL